MANPNAKDKSSGPALIGFALLALCFVGIAGVLGAVVALFKPPSPDCIGVGMCLTASALSFGLLLNPLLRS